MVRKSAQINNKSKTAHLLMKIVGVVVISFRIDQTMPIPRSVALIINKEYQFITENTWKLTNFPMTNLRQEIYKLPTGTLYIPQTTIIPNLASLYYESWTNLQANTHNGKGREFIDGQLGSYCVGLLASTALNRSRRINSLVIKQKVVIYVSTLFPIDLHFA